MTSNIHVIEKNKSIDVKWGTFSQCEATIRLIQAALLSGVSYDYLWLISGQDFPISDKNNVKKFLEKSKENSYIEIIDKKHRLYPEFQKRNLIYHNKFMLNKTIASKVFKRIIYIITGGKKYVFKCFRRKSDFMNYYGSSWWCLPKECIDEICSLIIRQPEMVEYFKHSSCPDESFFQTLFMMTSYAGEQQGNLTYIDWEKNSSSPKVFRMKDLQILKENNNKYLMARKFDIEIDYQILEELKKIIDEKNI